MDQPIITSLLENDLYKFSMGQAIYHQFPSYTTTWTFKCRTKNIDFYPDIVDEIENQIKAYCNLRFTEDELEYLSAIPWIKDSYINYLRLWHPRYEDFIIERDESGCLSNLEVVGTWLNTSMYEVPVLAIISEVYYKYSGQSSDYALCCLTGSHNLDDKIHKLIPENRKSKIYPIGNFSEFGLRRRFSKEFHEKVLTKFIDSGLCSDDYDSKLIGTSDVYLARKYNLKPVGTMAHEWIMCVGQGNPKHNPAYSNWYALDAWVKEYGILNGIALTDTITTDCFLKDFQLTFSTLFSGVRHDSGDPINWANKMIDHYKNLGIDPKTKTLLFSDSLNFDTAADIYYELHDKANVAFGIGTYLTNDTIKGPMNIVMKVTRCNGSDVAKLSDAPGKSMCKNHDYVNYLNRCIEWRMNH